MLDGERSIGIRFDKIMKTKGIVVERTTSYTSDQNRKAESTGKVIIRKARYICIGASLPTNLWPEINAIVAYLANRTPV